MIDYKYVQTTHQVFDVVESKTSLVIESNMNYDDARALTRHLNFGGGFAGNTPEFFIERIKIFS